MRGRDLAHAGDRDVVVLFAEMQHCRDARLQVLEADDAAAVVADGRRKARRLRRGEPGQGAAQAIADDADLAAALGRFDRRVDVEHRRLARDLLHQRASARQTVRAVGEIGVSLAAIENGRRDRRDIRPRRNLRRRRGYAR